MEAIEHSDRMFAVHDAADVRSLSRQSMENLHRKQYFFRRSLSITDIHMSKSMIMNHLSHKRRKKHKVLKLTEN